VAIYSKPFTPGYHDFSSSAWSGCVGVSCGYPISTHNPRCAVHMALSRLSASAERHVQKLRMMYRAYVDTGRPQCGNSMRMHYHLSQPTGQPLAPAAKQITLPEASSFSSSLTGPKAERTFKSLQNWTRTYQKAVSYASTSQKVWSRQILESRLRN
jgi:hypothetical protein